MNSPFGRRSRWLQLSISDADLQSYAAGELTPQRSAEIEGFLACNPDIAAQVMHLRHRSARTAAMLHASSRRTRQGFRLPSLLLIGVLCGTGGWALAEGLDDDGPFRDLSSIPEYVDDAIRSVKVTHLRIGMQSQEQTPILNTADIEQATKIRMPGLPLDWQLLDAQVYPSETGPSISVLMETPQRHKLSLFAVLADTRVGQTPVLSTNRGEYAAYWESGGAAYVLTGESGPQELLNQAVQLSRGKPL